MKIQATNFNPEQPETRRYTLDVTPLELAVMSRALYRSDDLSEATPLCTAMGYLLRFPDQGPLEIREQL